MATIRSIAEAANVSRGTVDKVLNDRPGVSTAVRERVRRIAEEMGYKPNLAGKALAFQKKDIRIGILGPSAADPLFLEVFDGIRRGIAEYANFGIQFEVIEMTQNTAQHQLVCIRSLQRRKYRAGDQPFDDELVRKVLAEFRDQGSLSSHSIPMYPESDACAMSARTARSGRVAADLMRKILHQAVPSFASGSGRFQISLGPSLASAPDQANVPISRLLPFCTMKTIPKCSR
jgi:LacI family transcriptional regulator